jgi:2-polyprenyl-3-methyl-5-hydroxy-6-metoxy-1,4-benzoquinol methylase
MVGATIPVITVSSAVAKIHTLLRPSDAGGAAERQAEDPGSPWWGEHVARYRFALLHLIPGTRSLDVACGAGYGLRALAQHGAIPYGVDVDRHATVLARQADPTNRSIILRGDGRRLPFPDGAFSMITSFETVEHVEDRAAFVGDLRRVLASDGQLILSTPNANHTRPVNGRPSNPFHLHEYTPEELLAELRPHFRRVQLVGQVLDGRFRTPPYWEDQRRLPRSADVQARLWARRAVHRLPREVRDRVSRTLWGHTFFPMPSDYHFDVGAADHAPTLVALCRP